MTRDRTAAGPAGVGQGDPAPSRGAARARAALWLLTAAAALLAGGFVALAAGRRLNFDEALILRAGWLALQDLPGAPSFYMPITLLVGALSVVIPDPGDLLLAIRLAAALVVLWALTRSFRVADSRPLALLAVCLTLANGVFVAHGFEFRYDWAILVPWLLALPWLSRRSTGDFWRLGVTVSWLAAHHLKGLFFGAALAILALAALAREPGARRPRVAGLAFGALAAAAVWLAISSLLGCGDELRAVYTTFFRLAAEGDVKVWPWSALGGVARRDTVWWIAALAAVAATGLTLRRAGTRSLQGDWRPWTLAMALVPLAFLFVHPLPWAYMLVVPAPFFALLMARWALAAAGRIRPLLLGSGLVLALALQIGVVGEAPWDVWVRSLRASRDHQVATLRLLRQTARPGDRIIDPSGLAYFVEPCIAEWYLDTLFERRAAAGRWMTALAEVDLASCPWVLNTYRLGMLPEDLEARLRQQYVLLEAGGGLALHHSDPRLASLGPGWVLPWQSLENFW